MLIPIRDDNPTSRTPWVTLALIAINVVVFLAWQRPWSSSVEQEFFAFCHAEIPWEVTHQTSLAEGGGAAVGAINRSGLGIPGRGLQDLLRHGGLVRPSPTEPPIHVDGCPHKSWWQSVFVAMFLHGGWLHIGGNMLYLWIFGNNVEDKIGRLRYLLFYLIAGVAAAVTQIATDTGSIIPSLGASGAIAGVLGAYLVMFPRRRVYSIVPIFFFASFIALPAIVVLGFWFVLQFFSGATTLSAHVNGGVAYFAHIGGFVTGVVAALLFFPKERRAREEVAPW